MVPDDHHADMHNSDSDISAHLDYEEPIPLNQRHSGHINDLGVEYAHMYDKPDSSGRTRSQSLGGKSVSSLGGRSTSSQGGARTARARRPSTVNPVEPERRRIAANGSDEEEVLDSEKAEKLDSSEFADLRPLETRDRFLGELELQYPDFKVKLSDEEKPLNWSVNKKLWHTLAYGFTTLTAQFGASALSPSAKSISEQYHVGREVTVLIFSIYVLGQAIGPLIFAPLSEVAGRKIGVFVPCFIAGIIMCSAANTSNVWALLIYRFIAGVFSAAPIVSSGGALGDLWKAESRAPALALYASAIGFGSSCSTILGALLDTTGPYGWRWVFWLSGLLQMALPALNFICLSESFTPVLERSKARRLRLDTGVWALHADLDAWRLTMDEFLRVHCRRPILMFVTPIIFVLVLYASFVYGLMFIAITSIGTLFTTHHNFSFVVSYLPLIGFFCGFATGCTINVLFSFHYTRYARSHGGRAPPEERLWAMMCFGWLLPSGLFIYGWTMRQDTHWFTSVLGIFFCGGGVSVVFQGSLVYMVDCYTKYAASAIAANTFMRSIFGGVFPLFSLQMYGAMGPAWASSLLAFVGLALWPFPVLFYKYGARLRKINPYEHLLT